MKLCCSIPLLAPLFLTSLWLAPAVRAQSPRCEVTPLAGHQVSLRIDGVEKTRWHYGSEYPRPFFFPFNGPSGESLTRMGHPGAPNHDHHRSVWFAHQFVGGDQPANNFWGDSSRTQVRQKQWLAYSDSDEEAVMAIRAGWYNAAGKELMETDMIAALRPLGGDLSGHALELQLVLRPPAGATSVSLAKTNFGFLAVRVAKSISGHFGGGTITSSEGGVGEKAIFGRRARWIDYSGAINAGAGPLRKKREEGVTYFDHPANPGHPAGWHVREDGWMGAGFCMFKPYEVTTAKPLTLRYMLHAHAGRYNAATAATLFKAFSSRAPLAVAKAAGVPHRHYVVKRVKPTAVKKEGE